MSASNPGLSDLAHQRKPVETPVLSRLKDVEEDQDNVQPIPWLVHPKYSGPKCRWQREEEEMDFQSPLAYTQLATH